MKDIYHLTYIETIELFVFDDLFITACLVTFNINYFLLILSQLCATEFYFLFYLYSLDTYYWIALHSYSVIYERYVLGHAEMKY